MAIQPVKKPGNVDITAVGHTSSGSFGTDPNAQVRGRSKMPTRLKHDK